jgi:hypothetical protein
VAVAVQGESVGQSVPPVIHGVDFSGADSGGAAKIRVVTRDLADPRAPVVPMGRMDRRGLARAVLASREDGRTHLWRVDAPMSVPLEIAREFGVDGSWLDVARWMASLGSPRHWRGTVRDRTRREPRRACDRELATPMAPMNLRVFKQTWTFVSEVLLPLAEEGIRIEPCHAGLDARVRVCEGCPSSVLHAFGWPRRGYKGAGEPPRLLRAQLVRRLGETGVTVPAPLAAEAERDEEGDLLDAMLLVTPPVATAPPACADVEGWVY